MVEPSTRDFIALALQAQSPLVGWGAVIESIDDGAVRLSMPITPSVTTFTGAVVSGVIATLADVAAGLSLITVLTPPRPVITLDFTTQQLAPAIGTRLIAVGRAERAGKAIGFASADAFVTAEHGDQRVARLSATFSIRT